ncbi:hypothetical protein ACO1O0_005929 [Amphichorda felina]
MPSATRTLATALAGAVTVAAHGYVSSVVINGVSYSGYDVTSFPYQDESQNPVVIGWSSSATDLGFVAPDAYSDPDIICHRDSKNAKGHAKLAAGDSIFLQWNTWPESHHGPVIDYLARCGDAGCESVDKTTLEFFKIDEAGLVDGSGAPGLYASDDLMDNGLGWMVKVPEDIAPGSYVLRHEIIALHSANEANGAQNYPQCFNLEITGSGTSEPAGVLGTELYTAEEEGIHFNIYTALDSYPIPGPALIKGASAIEQTTSAIKETGTATQGSGSAPTGSAPAPEPTTDAGAEPTPTSAPGPDITPIITSTAAPTSVVTVPTSASQAPEQPEPTSVSQTPEQPEPTGPSCRPRKHGKKHGRKTKKVRRHSRAMRL